MLKVTYCTAMMMNSKGSAEQEKCSRFCLRAGGDASLWYESITPEENDWDNMQSLFYRDFFKIR